MLTTLSETKTADFDSPSYPPGSPQISADVRWRFPTVRYLLGIFLLLACGLKLLNVQTATLSQPGWIWSPRLQMTAIQWELFLGIWLLSGVGQVAAWLAALGTFLIFAGISGSLAWIGVAQCACFGYASINPWYTFCIDLAVLGLLCASQPKTELAREGFWKRAMRLAQPTVFSLLVVVTLLGLAAAGGSWAFGSMEDAIAWLRDEPLSISSGYVDFGNLHSLDKRTVSITVRNKSDRPARLLGGTSDCSCVTSLDLPLTVPPHGECMVNIRLKVPRSEPGIFSRTAEIWTDDERQGTLRFRVGCRVE